MPGQFVLGNNFKKFLKKLGFQLKLYLQFTQKPGISYKIQCIYYEMQKFLSWTTPIISKTSPLMLNLLFRLKLKN